MFYMPDDLICLRMVFATLTMWEKIMNPWVLECNSDRTDCRYFWRKSRTAYITEDQTLGSFLTNVGAWSKDSKEQENASNKPVFEVVGNYSSTG